MRSLLFSITALKLNNFNKTKIFSVRVGRFIKIRTFLSIIARELRHKGLCLSFRRKRNFFSSTIKIRNKAFASDMTFLIFNPSLKVYFPGEDGIRTHG